MIICTYNRNYNNNYNYALNCQLSFLGVELLVAVIRSNCCRWGSLNYFKVTVSQKHISLISILPIAVQS
jgi:hypothetical protein